MDFYVIYLIIIIEKGCIIINRIVDATQTKTN